jgi:uncharacterized membrane protein
VDIALKGLSPGINDTTTAVMCVDYLTAILARLADRQLETPGRGEAGGVQAFVLPHVRRRAEHPVKIDRSIARDQRGRVHLCCRLAQKEHDLG